MLRSALYTCLSHKVHLGVAGGAATLENVLCNWGWLNMPLNISISDSPPKKFSYIVLTCKSIQGMILFYKIAGLIIFYIANNQNEAEFSKYLWQQALHDM